LWVSLWWDLTDNSQLDGCCWLVNQSQEKTATTEVQPHQFNATPTSSGKRLNRCYQFNATVLVLFLLWGPIILMQKIYIY
jgi:hypothetical protein